MPDKNVQYKIQTCEECDSQMIPNFYPGNEYTKPENGISYLASVVPAWTCPNCGFHSLVLKEESNDWLFANISWQRSLVAGMNLVHELAEAHGIETCEECNGCDNREEPGSEEETEENPEGNEGIVH